MATINTGTGRGGRRQLDRDIPLIPFVDFLLCLISFLLVTAVWNQAARIDADARLGAQQRAPAEVDAVLHVDAQSERTFRLSWRSGATVLDSLEVPRRSVFSGEELSYPELGTAVRELWGRYPNRHYGAADLARDRASVNVNNSEPFNELVAILDAVRSPTRSLSTSNGSRQVPALSVGLSNE